jgi:hypothetical protein
MKELLEAAKNVLEEKKIDSSDLDFLTKVVSASNDDKFKKFMSNKIGTAANTEHVHFIIQDIADHFGNFGGGINKPMLSKDDALHVQKLSKKYK